MDVSDDPRGHLELITRVFPYHTIPIHFKHHASCLMHFNSLNYTIYGSNSSCFIPNQSFNATIHLYVNHEKHICSSFYPTADADANVK
jgi:hypothetical protein